MPLLPMLQFLGSSSIYQTTHFTVIAFGITEVNHQKIFGHPMSFIAIHEIIFLSNLYAISKGFHL